MSVPAEYVPPVTVVPPPEPPVPALNTNVLVAAEVIETLIPLKFIVLSDNDVNCVTLFIETALKSVVPLPPPPPVPALKTRVFVPADVIVKFIPLKFKLSEFEFAEN